jgi:hypothetical protein
MQTQTRFAAVALAAVAFAMLTGCTADPAIATGAAFPGPHGPGIVYLSAPPATVADERVAIERVHEARVEEFRALDRPIARRPRSGCPSCD